MWRRITAGGMALAMVFGWMPAGWAEVVAGEEIAVNGAVVLPADTIPPEETSVSQDEVAFQKRILEALDAQGAPSSDSGLVSIDAATVMHQDPKTGQIICGTPDPDVVLPPEGVGNHDDPTTEPEEYGYWMDMLIGQIDGEISTANWNAYELTMALDVLEQSSDEGGGSGTEPVAGESAAVEGAGGGQEKYSFVAAAEEDGQSFVATEGESMALEEVQSPPPIVGTATGPTTAVGIKTMLQGRRTTLEAQLAGLGFAQTQLITIRDRAQRLFNARAIARAELDHANAMVAWIGRRIARVNVLVAIADAPAANVPALVGAFNGQAVAQLAGRVTFLEGEEGRLVDAINTTIGLIPKNGATQEDLNRLRIALGLARADLAQARQDKADGQATAAAGGIVLTGWDPAPPFPGR